MCELVGRFVGLVRGPLSCLAVGLMSAGKAMCLSSSIRLIYEGSPVAGEGKPQSTSAFPTLPCITFASVAKSRGFHLLID